jgi:hypothetical protein
MGLSSAIVSSITWMPPAMSNVVVIPDIRNRPLPAAAPLLAPVPATTALPARRPPKVDWLTVTVPLRANTAPPKPAPPPPAKLVVGNGSGCLRRRRLRLLQCWRRKKWWSRRRRQITSARVKPEITATTSIITARAAKIDRRCRTRDSCGSEPGAPVLLAPLPCPPPPPLAAATGS